MAEVKQGTLLGRTAYRLYHRPRAFVRETLARGVAASVVDERHRRAMVATSFELPPPRPDPAAPGREVCFLTGAKYAHQTAFCAWSLAKQAPDVRLRPVVHDDGSLRREQAENLRRLFPEAEFVSAEEAEALLDNRLPRSQFPRLRGHRDVKPLLKKLTDFYAGRRDLRLFLDSDMLFFRRPEFLLRWLEEPGRPLYMVDVVTAYGYSPTLLEELAGGPIPPKINIGVMGLDGCAVDWEATESRIAAMLDREGPHYNITQGLCAIEMTVQGSPVAPPAEEYLVLPSEAEVREPTAVMHHYVADSKPWYYRYGWRRAVERAGSENGRGRR